MQYTIISFNTAREFNPLPSEGEAASTATTSWESTALLEEELLPALLEAVLERMAMTALGIVRIVSVVEACAKLGIAEDLVRFVNGSHLLLRSAFVRVGLSGFSPVGFLDRTVVGFAGDTKNLVVVFLPRLFQ